MAKTYPIPILSLPVLPGPLDVNDWLPVQSAGATYRTPANALPLATDTFITWGDQSAKMPFSRRLIAGTGVSIDTSTPNQAIIAASVTNIPGNAATATTLLNPRSFNLSGVNTSGAVFFDGSANVDIGITGVPWGLITGAPSTIGGYGITDAYTKTEVNGLITGLSSVYQPVNAALTEISGLANSGGVLTNDGSGNLSWAAVSGTGTVTSVAASVPTGLSLSGSPITTAGTLAISWAAGYQGFTSAESSKLAGIAANATVGAVWGTNLSSIPAPISAYAGGSTPSAFTLGIVSSADAVAWRAAIGAGTSSVTVAGTNTQVQFNNGGALGASSGLTWSGTTLTATNLAGAGGGITSLNASNISGGTLADARLSSNIPLKNANQSFTGANQFAQGVQVTGIGTAGFSGPGTELYNTGVVGGVQAYNRTAAAYMPLYVIGSTLSLRTGSSAQEAVGINSSGNVVVNLPVSGASLTVGADNSRLGLLVQSAGGSQTAVQLSQAGVSDWTIYIPAGGNSLRFWDGSDRIIIGTIGSNALTVAGNTVLNGGALFVSPPGGSDQAGGFYADNPWVGFFNADGTVRRGYLQGLSSTGGLRIYADAGDLELNTAGGNVTVNSERVGYARVLRRTSGVADGECTVITTGVTIAVGYAAGTCFSLYNDSGSAVTLTQDSGLTLRLAGTATTGNRTLAARGMCTIWANSTTEYIIAGSGVS